MALTLAVLNQALDAILKLLFLGLLVYLLLVLKSVHRAVRSVERSAESLEETSDRIGKLLTLSRYLPFVGGRDERDS